MPKRKERVVRKRVFSGKKPKAGVLRKPMLIATSRGNRVIAMPGVKQHEIIALLPENWSHETYYNMSGRSGKGQGYVFTAETKDSNGKKFRIQCRSIREHYTTTHEARMLLHLQAKGFRVEQPLAVIIGKQGERMIVTRYIEGKTQGMFSEVKNLERELKKEGIIPIDLHRYGRENFVFTKDAKGNPVLYIIDVEHYSAKDKKSRLGAARMAR